MNLAKRFHISDVLSATTGRLLSTRKMDGIYEILNHLTGDSLYTHQLPRAFRECKPFLLAQFPMLDSPEMQFAVGELLLMLESEPGASEPWPLILGWLSKLTLGQYGIDVAEYLDVESIPAHAHVEQDPLAELAKMAGNTPVTVVVTK